MTNNELKKLCEAIRDGVLQGMGNAPIIHNGVNIGDPNGKGYNGTARKTFLDNLAKQSKTDKENEIDRKIKELKHNTSKLAELKRKELEEEKERLQNGGISKKDEAEYEKKLKKEKWDKISKVANGIFKIIEAGVDMWVAYQERELAYSKATLEKNVQITQTNLKKQTQVISTGMKGITAGFTKNVVDVSMDLVQSSYDIAKTAGTTYMEFDLASKKYNKAITEADAKFGSSMIRSGGAIAGAITGALVGSVVPVIGTAVGAIVGGAVGLIASTWDKIWGINVKKQELAIEQQEQAKNLFESYSDSFKQITEPWDNLYNESTKFVLKIKDAAQQFSRIVGYGGTDFASTMLKMSQVTVEGGSTLAEIFGKETEKLPQIMDSYIQSSGRAVNMSAEDYGNIMGTGRLFGMSSEEASGLYGSMNIFNTSISSASDSMSVMYSQITRMGLSSKKFGKDLLENLKLAQKYNFKGGVDNMMKLTKWSQQTRFNLNSAASFADSIVNDSLSGALEKTAKLQVLGGSAAMYSDPLGMLYDAGADVGNMAKRMSAMFNDVTGTFNKKTGETDFSWYENKMINERAKALGMDPGEVKNMIRQNKKQGVINRVLKGSGLDEEDKLAIGNRATYNQKKNRWEVTDIHGETHDIHDYANGNAKIEDLLPADTQESILKVSQNQLSVQEKIEAAVSQRMGKLGVAKEGEIEQATLDKQKTMDDFYNNNWEGTLQMWENANSYSKSVVEKTAGMMEESLKNQQTVKDIYDGNLKRMDETIKSIDGELKEAAKVFTNDIEIINTWLLQKVGAELSEDQQTLLKNSNLLTNQYEGQKPQTTFTEDMSTVGASLAPGGSAIALAHALKTNNVVSVNQKVNDAYINQKGVVTPIHDNDSAVVFKENGPIMKNYKENDKNENNTYYTVKHEFSGKIELSQDGSTLNLVDLLKNNPSAATKFITMLTKAAGTNTNGKPEYSYNMF